MSIDGNSPRSVLDLVREPSVLIVEDDVEVATTLRRFIEKSGLKISWARDGAEAILMKESMRPDVVLIDLSLPDTDGSQLVRRFADHKDCGIIVVSGRSDEVERVVSIELGADDYVTKPVPSLRELVARIRAVHRRSNRGQPAPPAAA